MAVYTVRKLSINTNARYCGATAEREFFNAASLIKFLKNHTNYTCGNGSDVLNDNEDVLFTTTDFSYVEENCREEKTQITIKALKHFHSSEKVASIPKTLKRSTVGIMATHPARSRPMLARVHYYELEDGQIMLSAVSGHNLEDLGFYKTISHDDYVDIDEDPYNSLTEARAALGLLGFTTA